MYKHCSFSQFTSIVSLLLLKYKTILSEIRCSFVKIISDVMLIFHNRAIDVVAIPHYTTDVLANCYAYPYHVIS